MAFDVESITERWRHHVLLGDSIPDGAISALALFPHAKESGVPNVYDIDNAHVSLAGVLTMQSPGVLQQRALPRYWHCQHQGVQRRMIEAFAD